MKALILICLFLLACGGAASSEADSVNVKAVYAPAGSEDSICPAFVPWVLSGVQQLFKRDMGLDLRFSKIVRRGEECPTENPAPCWNDILRPRITTLVIAPPLVRKPHLYYAGWALPRLAVAQCGGGIPGCVIAATHELLHTMGAHHTNNGCSIMSPAALKCRANRIDRKTVLEVTAFLGK